MIAAIFQTGCKENTLINSKISPSNNAVTVTSYSLPVITHSYFDDSTATSTDLGGIPIYQAVGSITDPFFGTMTSSTFFQVVPYTSYSPSIYSGMDIDSAVLILPYSGFTYGDTTSTGMTQTFQVFYMLDTMGLYSNYYSFSTKPIDLSAPLSDPATVNIFHLKDSFGIYTQSVDYPSVRIKLKLPVLMSHIMPALQASSVSTSPVQTFLDQFYGICVRVANSRNPVNAMTYFQLDGGTFYSEAAVLVYYHPFGNPTDTLTPEAYYFNSSSCAHFNNITRTFSQYPVNNLIHSGQANDSVIALTNQPGVSLDVLIPGIKSKLTPLLNGGIINKAELQLALLPGYYSANNSADTLAAPENVSPLGIGNGTYPPGIGAGLAYEIADRYPLTSLTPLSVMDGYLHAFNYGSTTVEKFTIDLPRELIASIGAGNDTLHLHISGTSDFYGAFHLVAGGGGYPNRGANYADSLYVAKFVVTYSKLKN